ncbi:hypothetical protein H5410_063191 [Solanum commersonii]|uniref:Uncharacterized protein n=1 Tax=Solanum commersonii TaxID=4109 RepID=A0A9J5WCL5_SOLCO|nr:hypothetical protein H5410_063191 [Solanum commersonii]
MEHMKKRQIVADQVLQRIYMIEEYVLSAMTIQETVSLFLVVIVQLANINLCCLDSPKMKSHLCWIPKLLELWCECPIQVTDLEVGSSTF